jgi:hypothetical protein
MKYIILLSFTVVSFFAKAQTDNANNQFKSRFYGAWGYNKEWYSTSTIKVSQPSLGNNFEYKDIAGNDHIGWDKLFQRQPTIPQYNYRLGFFLKKHPTWGFELNFDHTKYQMTPGQNAHIVGTINNKHVDTNYVIQDSYTFWKLNNGANFFLFNIMKRYYICGTKNGNLKFFNLYKAGIGFMIPHTDNTIMGHDNNQGFQFGGFDVGLEAAYRLEIGKYIYLDLAQKVDYAYYYGLHVYEGTAKQSFSTFEVIATIGFMIPYKAANAQADTLHQ